MRMYEYVWFYIYFFRYDLTVHVIIPVFSAVNLLQMFWQIFPQALKIQFFCVVLATSPFTCCFFKLILKIGQFRGQIFGSNCL